MPTSTQACTTFVPQFYVPVQNYANYRPPASSVRNITADFNQVTDVDEIHGVNEVNEVSPSSDTYKNTTSRRVLMAVLAMCIVATAVIAVVVPVYLSLSKTTT
ncbi:unnamed protein product, partial [Rotaria socialis]